MYVTCQEVYLYSSIQVLGYCMGDVVADKDGILHTYMYIHVYIYIHIYINVYIYI
jgi:hypothetical protein